MIFPFVLWVIQLIEESGGAIGDQPTITPAIIFNTGSAVVFKDNSLIITGTLLWYVGSTPAACIWRHPDCKSKHPCWKELILKMFSPHIASSHMHNRWSESYLNNVRSNINTGDIPFRSSNADSLPHELRACSMGLWISADDTLVTKNLEE